ncbi:MAG: DNA repair protein RecN [Planctomycetaceae bacterium]|nr:DNA repair protein RecN [Planctomycetaceae bacterium]
MLCELHISNLAIIEKVDIEFGPGLNVFTGATGAGKSLILGALELLLGLRGGGEDAAMFVRPGSGEARVSGVFEVARPAMAAALGRLLDQEIAPSEPIVMTRRVLASGRSSVSVNGNAVTAAMLRQAGELLVDIHGQHDQQFLLKNANQLQILDAFADALELREQFAAVFSQLRDNRQRLADLKASCQARDDQLDLYRFQMEEIDAAAPAPGEYARTKSRYSVLKNLARLKEQSLAVLGGLAEGDEAVLDNLGRLSAAVKDLVRLDESLGELAVQFEQGEDILRDAARTLERYQDKLDVDEGQFEKTQQRLDELNAIIHKYARSAAGDDPLAAVLEYRRVIGEKAAALEADSQSLGGLEEEIAKLQRRLGQVGPELSRRRKDAGKRLKTLVEAQFAELEMPEATFDVEIVSRKADEPGVDGTGLDAVDFLVRTNPGQERLALRKIASGGELSRIMLALKTILADKDQITVLVFDEIDANIGDRLGATIGRKMRALAKGSGGSKKTPANSHAHQIICITHLSQIAACADHHLQISKDVVDGADGRQTSASVRVLEGEARVRELAEMMAGKNPTPATLTHAKQLLAANQRPVGLN